MALLASPLQFSRGKIMNVSFYRDQQGRCIARHHRGEVNDFYTNPDRVDQVHSAREFGTNAKAARSIRLSFHTYLKFFSDSTYFNRLMGLLRAVSDEDRTGELGYRNCFSGNMHLLSGYEFNKKRTLANSFAADYSTSINPATGAMRVELESFSPLTALKPPAGARYFQLIAIGAAISHQKPFMTTEVSDLIRIDSQETGQISLALQLEQHTGQALLLGLGVLYYEDYMGVPLMLRDGSFAIVDVEKPVPPTGDTSTPDKVLSAADRHAKHLAMQEQAMQESATRLYHRFPLTTVAHGDNTNANLPDLEEKMARLRRHLWLQRIDKFRRG